MTLVRRRPREVYRVYSEEEYLNGAGVQPASDGAWPVAVAPATAAVTPAGIDGWPVAVTPAGIDGWPAAVTPAKRGSGEHRLRRVAGVTMLAGVVGAVGGVVVLNNPWARGGAVNGPDRQVAAARSPVARPPVSKVPKVLDSQTAPARPVTERASASSRARASHTGRSVGHRGPRSPVHSSNHPLLRVPTDPREGVTVVVDYVPRSSSGAPSATGASATVGTTPAAVQAAPKPAVPSERAEFGFER